MSERFDIRTGYVDDSGHFMNMGQVEYQDEDYLDAYDEDGYVTDRETAQLIVSKMNEAAAEFYRDDVKDGVADDTGPIVHAAVEVKDTTD